MGFGKKSQEKPKSAGGPGPEGRHAGRLGVE
ncbi:hypothetical protein B14911_08842 [Bacillus sp. NRRL B-14911]|uniref:Uncharacterized protein n=1 Tax=Bacillus infantis NRRL B-14911 TaxID=1367477 RepID=U5LD12_9BACI|nr:hypothetical protein N288_17250 [Bacillus infantis NRRL B-14911]EAR65346.1 hypothetical protein B14911_08842 [Bacillus sp. NRRL B-14911]